MKKILLWMIIGIIAFASGLFFGLLLDMAKSRPAKPTVVAQKVTEEDAAAVVTAEAMSYHARKSNENMQAVLKELESWRSTTKTDEK